LPEDLGGARFEVPLPDYFQHSLQQHGL
jgi:hypothetical protein